MNYEPTIQDIYKIAGKERTDRLLELIKEEALVKWFYQPNPAFQNKKPADLCGTKEVKKLDVMIQELEEGAFS